MQARINQTAMRLRRGTRAHRKQRDGVFRAIADPTRREILGILRSGPCAVGQIAENFRMSLQAVSNHLTMLSAAGLAYQATQVPLRPIIYTRTTWESC